MKTLMIAGSLRVDSYNRKVLKVASRLTQEAGCEVKEADLKELALPVLNDDDKPSLSVKKFNSLVSKASFIIIATPEYNRSIPGGLKNALDHLSGTTPLEGKVVAIMGTSTGGFGTVRSQLHLKEVLSAMGAYIIPKPEIYISYAKEAFNKDGSFKDKQITKSIKDLIQRSIELVKKL